MSIPNAATTRATNTHCSPTDATPPTGLNDAALSANESQRVNLAIASMTCGHCVSRVRDALAALDGVRVEQVRIGRASVTVAPQGASRADLIEALHAAGYDAAVVVGNDTDVENGLPQASAGSSCCAPR